MQVQVQVQGSPCCAQDLDAPVGGGGLRVGQLPNRFCMTSCGLYQYSPARVMQTPLRCFDNRFLTGESMAGLKASSPAPQALTVHEQSRVLEVVFSDGAQFRIPFELMRVYSPSAEVQGHGPGQEVLQTGKRDVTLVNLEPVGNYAVKPTFSDGHDTGLFTWDYLYELGVTQDAMWMRYTERLAAAGVDRDAPMAGKLPRGGAAGPAACGSHH